MKKLISNKKGTTLIELILVVLLIGIVLLIIYNIYFISIKSHKRIEDEVEINRELRYFLINIQNEVTQARKANENKIHEIEEGPIFIKDNKYFCIYVDLDNDGKPELVQYFLEGNTLKRCESKTTDEEYPYVNYGNYSEPKVVLNNLDKNLKIDDVFIDIDKIEKESSIGQEHIETRKHVTIKINENEYYLITKSKVEFE